MENLRSWLALLVAVLLVSCGGRGGTSGPPCGAASCAAGDRCCDHCTGACVPEESGALCPDDNDPGRVCPGGDSATGVDSGAGGGDAGGGGGTDAAPPADSGGMCGATEPCGTGAAPCCDGLCCPTGTSCCLGVPVPPRAEYCAAGCPDG